MKGKHPVFDYADCVSCGICAQTCPLSCIGMTRAGKQGKYRNAFPELTDTACIGCGLCAKACPMDVIEMRASEQEEP